MSQHSAFEVTVYILIVDQHYRIQVWQDPMDKTQDVGDVLYCLSEQRCGGWRAFAVTSHMLGCQLTPPLLHTNCVPLYLVSTPNWA